MFRDWSPHEPKPRNRSGAERGPAGLHDCHATRCGSSLAHGCRPPASDGGPCHRRPPTASSRRTLRSAVLDVIGGGLHAQLGGTGNCDRHRGELPRAAQRNRNESSLEEARRLVTQFETPEALRDAMVRFIAENSERAYVLYRELDYFEQLGALEKHGGFDFELVRSLLGQRLIDRWDMWQPTIEAIGGRSTYPMFDQLVAKVRAAG